MAVGDSAGIAEVRDRMVLDFTRINDLYGIKRVCLNIHNEDNISVLINSSNFNSVSFDSQNEYNLYGYGRIDFKGNTFINYSTDLARSTETYQNKGDTNRYSNYKYAYHYPSPQSNWSKFSRFKSNDTNVRFLISTNDYYSFLSVFDTTVHPYIYNNFLELNNSNGPADNMSVEYHGRNIYKDRNFIYLKVDDNMYLTNGSYVTDVCKYMVFELEPTRKEYNLDGIFSLCNTHAYIVNVSADKLNITNLTGLLKKCKATKFGDITDSRTILNLTNVNDASFLCYNSNVEDMSMHTIRLNKSANEVNLKEAFSFSKIKKLPAGFVDSMSEGFKYLNASGIFYNSRNFETDISKINLPTLGSTPSVYYLYQMYMLSNCRHINRTIISTNDRDIINADSMYKGTTLIEDSPLPDGMFKNYKNTSSMFDGVTFENANTFKYIYGEFAKSANFTGSAQELPFNNIIIKNIISHPNSHQNIIIGEGDDYEKTKLVSFSSHPDAVRSQNTGMRLSIIGKRQPSDSNPIKVLAEGCDELSFGYRHDDIKRAAEAGNTGEFAPYFIKERDFLSSSYNGSGNSSEFFAAQTHTMGDVMFRRIAMLLPGNDYYRTHSYLFRGAALKGLKINHNSVDGYAMTSILYSNTKTSIDMLSLDEVVEGLRRRGWKTNNLYNGCVVINTNGKNLKWTLSRYHYNTLSSPTGNPSSDTYLDYLTVFSNARYLYKAINAQMYFTKDFRNEKIELIFNIYNDSSPDNGEALEKFLALMEVYHDPNDPKKPVGRFIMIHKDIYDSKTDMDKINALIAKEQDRREHIDEFKKEIKNHTFDVYDDGFLFQDEV